MMTQTTPQSDKNALAPQAESYLPEPKFHHTPSRREIDFAQIAAAGGDIIEALLISSLVTEKEYQAATRRQLYTMATRLLSSPAIQERIDYYLILHKASMSISVERVQQELAAVSFADFAQLFHQHDSEELVTDPFTQELRPRFRAGEPITNPHELPRHLRAAIKEWRIDKDGCLVAKFHDKLKSVKLLSEIEGYLDEANRAKAPQINIALGDGRGMDYLPQRTDHEVVEATIIPACME